MAKTIWLIWDGASHALVVDLLQRGALPHVQQVVARGGLAATAPPGPNSETPPGLMSLFTGCEEPDHGTPGFTAPLPVETRQSVLESVSGFEPRWLRRPPVWVDVAAAGRTVTLVSTAFAPDPQQRTAYPWPYPSEAYRVVIDGYNHEVARPQLVRLREVSTSVRLAERPYEVRRSSGRYTVLAPDGTSMLLEPFAVSQTLVPVWLDRAAGIGAYLACLTEPGKRSTDWLWCSAVQQLTAAPAQPWLLDLGPFLGAGIGWHFSRGVLGKGPRLTLATMEAVTCRVAAYFGELAWQALRHQPADLLVCYQPAIDEISHQMLRDALADWPYGEAARSMVQVYQEVDRQLGRCLALLEPDDTLLISSDHGHEPIHRSIRPNVLLRQAGLLQLNGDKIDLSRTRAVFHSSGWILINSTERDGGIVPPEEYASTLKDIERCLDAALDPSTGQPLGLQYSQSLWQGEAPQPGAMFVWAPDHVELRTHLFGTVCAPPEIGGNHQTVLHTSPYLKAMLAGCGPGLQQQPWPTRNVEVAALVRRTLGLSAAPTMTS
ncbi:MAG: alkaline phosphatase family protein [Candidatus Tectimicrobiota bacterium]